MCKKSQFSEVKNKLKMKKRKIERKRKDIRGFLLEYSVKGENFPDIKRANQIVK